MTTIPQRLRDIAKHIHECGITKDARRLKGIAAELEAPAADAAPVVGYLYEDKHGNQYLHQASNTAWVAPPQPLIRQRDHIATVSALQARINELEARQVPEGEVHFIQGGKLVGKIINVGSHPDTSKDQP